MTSCKRINVCIPFGYDEDEGMRTFAIAEMFLAGVHILTASYVHANIIEQINALQRVLTSLELVLVVLGLIFVATLVSQAAFSFLLYLKGWRERNGTICITWCCLAIANVLLSFLIVLLEISTTFIRYWCRFFFYLIYLFYGVAVVIVFLNWAKTKGIPSAGCCNFSTRKQDDLEENIPGEKQINKEEFYLRHSYDNHSQYSKHSQHSGNSQHS